MNHAKAVQEVCEEAAALFAVEPSALLSRRRTVSVSHARFVAIAVCRIRFGWSYPELGILFKRDHSTCIYACRWAKKNGFVLDLEAVAA